MSVKGEGRQARSFAWTRLGPVVVGWQGRVGVCVGGKGQSRAICKYVIELVEGCTL